MQWNNNLSTGIEKIDEQHKELIRLVNDVLEACKQQKGREIVGEALAFLEDYVLIHFSCEEEMQRKHLYPEYRSHKALHDQFINQFKNLKSRYAKEGASITVITALNRTLVEWLMEHIKVVDKAFADYLKKQN